jgi:hypothetical protein
MLASGNPPGILSSIVDLSMDLPEVVRQGAGDITMFV